jgi:hypothetical protein
LETAAWKAGSFAANMLLAVTWPIFIVPRPHLSLKWMAANTQNESRTIGNERHSWNVMD